MRWRISACPAGYALVRTNKNPLMDDCVMCRPGTFRLLPSTLAVSMDLNSSAQCTQCDPNAECRGSDIVEAREGYWRFKTIPWGTDIAFEYLPDAACYVDGVVCLFPEGSFFRQEWTGTMRCMRLPGGGDELFCARATAQRVTRRQEHAGSDTPTTESNATSRVWVFRCPVGACGSNNTCLQNRMGPVCGFCMPGFAMQTDGCSAELCPSEAELLPYKNLFSVLLGLVIFPLYLAFVARPTLPELDWLLSRALQGIGSCLSSTARISDSQANGTEIGSEGVACIVMIWGILMAIGRNLGVAERWAKEVHLTQFLKVCWRGCSVLSAVAKERHQYTLVLVHEIYYTRDTHAFSPHTDSGHLLPNPRIVHYVLHHVASNRVQDDGLVPVNL